MATFHNIKLERVSAAAMLQVNRPDRMNALNHATLAELLEATHQVAADESVRVLLLSGAGEQSFIAGADINEMAGNDYRAALAMAALGHQVCDAFEQLEKPVIAVINGYALGGGLELAMACDFAIASEDATLGQPEVRLGIIPGFGGTQRLMRRVPLGIARELIYTGRSISASEALALGLVNSVHPADQLHDRAVQIVEEIAARGPLAVAQAKRLMVEGLELPLRTAGLLERQSFAGLFASEDQKEGMRAFLEKREANFQGK